MSLVCAKELIRYAFKELSQNKGALTQGTTSETSDAFSETKVELIHKKLKTNQFIWTPIRRIYIPKPGKRTKRPLGIPSFTDKVVQHIIMTILTAIYEPEFEYVDANHGFRPNKGCNSAIRRIRINAHGMDHCVEADIDGAYNNVVHDKIIKILRKRIKDEKFLKLIKEGLRSGMLTDGTYEDSFIGTPQGGIASPILFNIYMNEFDKFVKFDLVNQISKKKEIKTEISAEYSRVDKLIKTRKTIIKRIDLLTPEEYLKSQNPTTEELVQFYLYTVKKIKPNQNLQDLISKRVAAQNNYKIRCLLKESITGSNTTTLLKMEKLEKLHKEIKEFQSIKLKTNRLDPERKNIQILYIRYADDWILFSRGTEALALEIKDLTKKWLSENLELELNQEKTKITELSENKAHFLGFEIFKQQNPLIKNKITENNEVYQQRYGTNIQIMPDIERLTNRFQIQNYTNKKGLTNSLPSLTVLEPHEIIKKFNQFMIGLGNYYIVEIDRPSALNKWHYLLYYCCLKTLAHKLKLSVSKIIKRYGYLDISDPHRKENEKYQEIGFNRRIIFKTKVKGKETRYTTLLNYRQFMMHILNLRKKFRFEKQVFNTNPIDFDYLKKANWRTKFKLTTSCINCGSTENLENHHIKPLKNQKYTGFDKTIGSLNRKQVTLCRRCHNMVHSGKYDGISLTNLYDVQLAIPETLLKAEPKALVLKSPNPKFVKEIIVDENNKTYYNSELEKYLLENNTGR
jgi:retron-type reverse transcriptase/5-methylcytosine-specific restriction endonuclease McrA